MSGKQATRYVTGTHSMSNGILNESFPTLADPGGRVWNSKQLMEIRHLHGLHGLVSEVCLGHAKAFLCFYRSKNLVLGGNSTFEKFSN